MRRFLSNLCSVGGIALFAFAMLTLRYGDAQTPLQLFIPSGGVDGTMLTNSIAIPGNPTVSTPACGTTAQIVNEAYVATCAVGGSGAVIANSTPTTGFSANQIIYSDGSKTQPATVGTGLSFSGGVLTSTSTGGTVTVTGGTPTATHCAQFSGATSITDAGATCGGAGGIPTGGAKGFLLGKNSTTNLDVGWLGTWAIDAQNEFGVRCNGATDDTVAINAALAAAYGSASRSYVQLPTGVCVVSQQGTLGGRGVAICFCNLSGGNPYYNVGLIGQGSKSTVIQVNSAAADGIVMGSPNSNGTGSDVTGLRLQGLSIVPGTTRTGGAGLHKYGTQGAVITDIISYNMFVGAQFEGTSSCTVAPCGAEYNTFVSYSAFGANSNVGMWIGRVSCTRDVNSPVGIYFDHVDASANGVGQYITCVGGLYNSFVQGINNGIGALIQPGSGEFVQGIKSVADEWDTSSGSAMEFHPNGGYVSDVNYDQALWSSSTGSNGSGLVVNYTSGRVQGLHFTNCKAFNNSRYGFYINSGSYIDFTGCTATLNGSGASNVYDGMALNGGSSNINVVGGFYGQSDALALSSSPVNPQRYGIYVGGSNISVHGVRSGGNNSSVGTSCASQADAGWTGAGVFCDSPGNTVVGTNDIGGALH